MPGHGGMHSARSDDEGDMDGPSDAECQKLRRQIRIMEKDRSAYAEESQNIIKKQMEEIEKLRKTKEELLKDMRQIEAQSNQNKDQRVAEELSQKADDRDTLEEQCKEEKKKQQELDAEIKETQKKVNEERANMGGGNQSAKNTQKNSKNIRVLENRLDQAQKKFNNMCRSNEEMRKEIDSLRVERRRFDDIYKKLCKEQEATQQEIGETIDQSTQAYDQRDEAQAKMILLKEKADKDLQQYNAETKELHRILDHDSKLREFMDTKCKERQEDAQLVAWRRRKEELEAQKKKASQSDSVETYEAAYERIKEITGEEDMNILVGRFIEKEDRNFALFEYVNEQNNQIEKLQEDIQEIEDDIEKFNSQGMELEDERKTIMKQLEEQQNNAAKEADDAEEKHKAVCKILDQLRAGVDSLYEKINCDRSAIDDMLSGGGGQEGVTDQNMMQHLGQIENRVTLYLLCHLHLQSQNDLDDFLRKNPTLIGPGPAAQQQTSSVAPPTVGDAYDSDASEVSEEEGKPFTRDELLNKAMKSVRKRENTMKKDAYKYDLSEANKDRSKKKDKKSGRY